jgi:hypothetical protein
MPTQVVVPSVSRANLLQGTAGTITVESSGPAFAKPAPVCGLRGLPGSGALTAGGALGPETAGACAEAKEIQTALNIAADATILNMATSV